MEKTATALARKDWFMMFYEHMKLDTSETDMPKKDKFQSNDRNNRGRYGSVINVIAYENRTESSFK